MLGLNLTRARRIGRAYLLSVGLWCGLSLVIGWQYHIWIQDLSIHSGLLDEMILAVSRGFAYALLTPPIFYIVHRYISGSKNAFRYLWAYTIGLGPFIVLCTCIRWVILPHWDAALRQYVPWSAAGLFELIRRGFADQITMYLTIVLAAHAYEYFARLQKYQMDGLESEQPVATNDHRPTQWVEIQPQLQKFSRRQSARVAIKDKGRILFIEPGDVIVVQAEGNCVLLQLESGSYLLRESLSAMAEKLEPYGFIRIHRSVLVNTAFVEEIRPLLTGEYGLRLKSGKEYTVTRTFKKNLNSLADFWIGTDTFLAA